MQSFPDSRHFLPHRSRYSPQHPVLSHPQCILFPSCERRSFTPTSFRYFNQNRCK
jgi:hypothetical protein